MDLKFKRKNKTLIILIAGEIDHHSSKELRSKTESALEQMGGRNIIFGFQEVTFMDSAGIGMVLGRYRRLGEAGGSVVIASCAKTVRSILHMAGIFSLMPYAQTREEAVKLLKEKEAAEWKEF